MSSSFRTPAGVRKKYRETHQFNNYVACGDKTLFTNNLQSYQLERGVKRFSIPAMAISLPLAIFATAVLISINEASFHESSQATALIEEAELARQSMSHLLETVLDAEAATHGFLLTGDERELAPNKGMEGTVGPQISHLRGLAKGHPEDLLAVETLASLVQRRQTEVAASVRLFKSGDQAGSVRLLASTAGKQDLQMIHQLSEKMMTANLTKIQAAHAKISQSLMLSRIGVAAMGLSALLAFYMYLRQTGALLKAGQREQAALKVERDRLEKQVRERTARLAQLATHLQDIREDERNHLARELHDELGALLTAAKLDVARIKARLGDTLPEASERLAHLNVTLNSGIALKRRIVEDLRPSALSNLGLVASLDILAREFADQSGLAIQPTLEPVELGESAQLTVYRLVQEALTNIGKYAGAKHVDIRLRRSDDFVVVDVIDDGQGFDTDKLSPTQHGLAGMRHRVEAAGGQLSVTSASGRGTQIHAELPVAR
jgi:signal transduction histidine kinase